MLVVQHDPELYMALLGIGFFGKSMPLPVFASPLANFLLDDRCENGISRQCNIADYQYPRSPTQSGPTFWTTDHGSKASWLRTSAGSGRLRGKRGNGSEREVSTFPGRMGVF